MRRVNGKDDLFHACEGHTPLRFVSYAFWSRLTDTGMTRPFPHHTQCQDFPFLRQCEIGNYWMNTANILQTIRQLINCLLTASPVIRDNGTPVFGELRASRYSTTTKPRCSLLKSYNHPSRSIASLLPTLYNNSRQPRRSSRCLFAP